jgi:SAM-dependent methyltransferase
VTGVDISASLLEEARSRAGAGENPTFVEADLRQLPFEDGGFDCALNLFSSIGFLRGDGDLDVLRELARVLAPGGRLVVETMHRDRLAAIFRERDWEPLPDGGLFLEERRFDPVAGVIEGTHIVIREGHEFGRRDFWLRVYTATELVALVERAGFTDTHCQGGLEGGPVTRDTRLALVATR